MGVKNAALVGAAAVYVVAVVMALLPHVQEAQHELFASAAKRMLSGSGRPPPGAPADVAVILGYACDAAGRPTPLLRNRVQIGLNLFVRGEVEHLMFTGSHDGSAEHGDVSEAACMRQYAVEVADTTYGPESRMRWEKRWYVEEESTSTRENAVFTYRLLLFGMRRLVIVTNRFHMLRSVLTFERAARELEGAAAPVTIAMGPIDAEADAIPVTSLAAVAESQFLLVREACALLYYYCKGFV